MSDVVYQYTKSPVDVNRLDQEIRASAIITALRGINLLGTDDLSITMAAELSSGDETILDGLVTAHTGEPLPDSYVQQVNIVQSATPKDVDGSPLQRIKVTAAGWNFQLHGIEFETSQLDSLYSKKADGTDFGFASMKFYKNDNGTLVECSDQSDANSNCIETHLDWEPTHNYEIIGGTLMQKAIPESPLRLWVIGVPDIPAGSGGSKVFVANINMQFIGLEGGIRSDGRAPKLLTYSATYHTNKMRVVLKHPAGFKHKLHMIYEIFKP